MFDVVALVGLFRFVEWSGLLDLCGDRALTIAVGLLQLVDVCGGLVLLVEAGREGG